MPFLCLIELVLSFQRNGFGNVFTECAMQHTPSCVAIKVVTRVSDRPKSCGLPHEFNTQRLFFSFIVCVKQKIILLYALIIAFFHFSWMCLRLQEEMSFYLRKLPNSSILIRSKSSIDLWNCQAVFSLVSFSLNGNFISRKPGNIKCHQWST